MEKIKVIYWSGTGNTEMMADMIANGIKEGGKEAELLNVEDISADILAGEGAFALGCPSMGAEELEESVMEPFVSELEGSVSGKKILLFGSYGWGDGEWMRNWVERMEGAGAVMIEDEGIIVNGAPEADGEAQLVEAGKKLAAV